MPAAKPSGTSFHWRSQTVLQEIRDVLPTELIRVRGLNEPTYHKTNSLLGNRHSQGLLNTQWATSPHRSFIGQWNAPKCITTWTAGWTVKLMSLQNRWYNNASYLLLHGFDMLDAEEWTIQPVLCWSLPKRSTISALVMTSMSASSSRCGPWSCCRDRSVWSRLFSASNVTTRVLSAMMSSAILLMAER